MGYNVSFSQVKEVRKTSRTKWASLGPLVAMSATLRKRI